MLEEGRAGDGHSRAKRERRLRTGRHGERFSGYAWRALAGALGGHPHEGRGRAALHGDVLDARRISPSLIYRIFTPSAPLSFAIVHTGNDNDSPETRGRLTGETEKEPFGFVAAVVFMLNACFRQDRIARGLNRRHVRGARHFSGRPPGPVTGIKTVFSSGPSFLCGIVPLRHCGTPSLIRPHYTFLRGCLRRRIQHIWS